MLRYVSRSIYYSGKNGNSRNIRKIVTRNLGPHLKFVFHKITSSSLKIHQRFSINARHFSSSKDTSEPANEVDVDEPFDMVEEDMELSGIVLIRQLLYPNSEDELIQNLTKCDKTEQVFEILSTSLQDFNEQHATQAVLVLWDILKDYQQPSLNFPLENLIDFKENKLKSNVFNLFLGKLQELVPKMSDDELTSCLLYLEKIGIDMKSDLMQDLIETFLSLISKNDLAPISLTALSRFVVAVNYVKGLYAEFTCIPIIPLLSERLNNATNGEELRLITICLNHLHTLTTTEMLNIYTRKVKQLLIEVNPIEISSKSILKIINFLNYPHWSHENNLLIRELSLLLKDRISSFQVRELVAIHKVIQSQLEPAILIPYITEQSQKLLNENVCAEILSCSVFYSLPEKRLEMTNIVEKLINVEDKNLQNSVPALFKVLRLLKISNVQIVNEYWNKAIELIDNNAEERKSYRLVRHSHRYMHFNNNLGGTYRHPRFERTLIKLILHDLKHDLSGIIPSRFAKLTSFIIAYGHTSDNRDSIPEFIIEKLENMAGQFSIYDTLHISRGIQIATEMRYRKYITSKIASQFLHIYNVLDNCLERYLKRGDDLSLNEINYMIRTYNNKKSSRKSDLFIKLIEKYENDYQLNSRLIRDITFNLNASNSRVDAMHDRFLHYIDKNMDAVSGDTVEKILYCGYNLGYVPEDGNRILKKCSDIIIRDFQYMSGLSIIQACLALCFYKALPEILINRVFNIDFIRHLEQEIQMCYSKATYPERVLNQVMKLNRAVCLDFPEVQVPWFQQNYIEAQMSKQPTMRDQFHQDCKKLITSLVQDESLLRVNHVTPYGYRIDFVLHIDNKLKKFIKPPKNGLFLENVTKIAVLLLKLEAFCENNQNFMKGGEYLRERHLEILGYRVVHVNYNEWNSMYMSVPGARENYIRDLLQIS